VWKSNREKKTVPGQTDMFGTTEPRSGLGSQGCQGYRTGKDTLTAVNRRGVSGKQKKLDSDHDSETVTLP